MNRKGIGCIQTDITKKVEDAVVGPSGTSTPVVASRDLMSIQAASFNQPKAVTSTDVKPVFICVN